jgi:ketosteroid isomerase-like protein
VAPGLDDLAATVERLLAYEEIRRLVHRYAVAVDARDLDAIVSLFVDDVRVAPGVSGRDALWASFDEMLARNEYSILHVTTVAIDLDDPPPGDPLRTATGVVYCRAEMPDGDGWLVQAIAYHDRYERRDGTWYFHSRDHRLFYGADLLERPLDLPPAGEPEIHRGKGSMPQRWDTWRTFRDRHRPR